MGTSHRRGRYNCCVDFAVLFVMRQVICFKGVITACGKMCKDEKEKMCGGGWL